jgi:hypothetical protein
MNITIKNMKKITLTIATLFLLTSCELEQHYESQETIYIVPGMNGGNLKIYEFDSCQWVGRLRGATDDVLTHRARCKYCEQRNKK